jgi:hypothetical protein
MVRMGSDQRFLLLTGPPAVGKMTVGRRIAARSEMRLFHNHATIEPLLEVFDYGVPPFMRLMGEWRRRLVEEAAEYGTSLVFTFVFDMMNQGDMDHMRDLLAPYADRGAVIAVAELVADLDTRLSRNRTEHRLAVKASKRDLEWSDGNVRALESCVMVTDPTRPPQNPGELLIASYPHLRLDNTHLSPDEAADRILEWLDRLGRRVTDR